MEKIQYRRGYRSHLLPQIVATPKKNSEGKKYKNDQVQKDKKLLMKK